MRFQRDETVTKPIPPQSFDPGTEDARISAVQLPFWKALWGRFGEDHRVDRFWDIIALISIIAIAIFAWGCIDNQQIGFTHDDGVYAIAGKSLAEGKGFRLLHVVGQPGEVKYPIVYPLILSLVWHFSPNFPANLPWMNLITVLFSVSSCALIYGYISRAHKLPGWISILAVWATVSNYFFIYFFTTLLSEGPYLFFSILTLWVVAHQSDRGKQWSIPTVILVTLLSLLTYQTRVLGISLMAAIGFWLLLARQWRNAFLYGALCFIFGIIPWLYWIKTQTLPLTDLSIPIVNSYSNYVLELQGNFVPALYFNDLKRTLLVCIFEILENMAGAISNLLKFFPAMAKNPTISNWSGDFILSTSYLLVGYFILLIVTASQRAWNQRERMSRHISVPVLYVLIYLVIIVFWHYDDQINRFLTVLMPLFWLYFCKPFANPIQSWLNAEKKARLVDTEFEGTIKTLKTSLHFIRLKAGFTLLSLGLFFTIGIWSSHQAYSMMTKARQEHWVESGRKKYLWSEYQQSFAWIHSHIPEGTVLGANNDVLYYLYTGHPTLYVFFSSLKRFNGQYTNDSGKLLMASMDHYGVKYVVAEPHMIARTYMGPMNKVIANLINEFPERFQLVYGTPQEAIGIFRLLPPNTRHLKLVKAANQNGLR